MLSWICRFPSAGLWVKRSANWSLLSSPSHQLSSRRSCICFVLAWRSWRTISTRSMDWSGTLIDHRAVELPPSSSMSSSGTPSKGAPTGVTISPLAQVYLQDVHDHVRTLSASTHMSIRAAENLTALIFNTIAASQNESVRQLTLVSCFFLPLTFLTGTSAWTSTRCQSWMSTATWSSGPSRRLLW